MLLINMDKNMKNKRYILFNLGNIPLNDNNYDNYQQEEFSIRPGSGFYFYETSLFKRIEKFKIPVYGYINNIGWVSLNTFIRYITFLKKEVFPDIYCVEKVIYSQ